MVRYERGDVVEEGVDRGEAGVARADAVLSSLFEVVEEGGDEEGIQLLEAELGGSLTKGGPERSARGVKR